STATPSSSGTTSARAASASVMSLDREEGGALVDEQRLRRQLDAVVETDALGHGVVLRSGATPHEHVVAGVQHARCGCQVANGFPCDAVRKQVPACPAAEIMRL